MNLKLIFIAINLFILVFLKSLLSKNLTIMVKIDDNMNTGFFNVLFCKV